MLGLQAALAYGDFAVLHEQNVWSNDQTVLSTSFLMMPNLLVHSRWTSLLLDIVGQEWQECKVLSSSHPYKVVSNSFEGEGIIGSLQSRRLKATIEC